MEKGAEKATTLIEYAGEKQKRKTEPTAEDAKVNPKCLLMYNILMTLKLKSILQKCGCLIY